MSFQKDTLMIQHHIDLSQLNCCSCGGALIQTGHSYVQVSIRANYTVLKVEFIIIRRHREFCRNKTTHNGLNGKYFCNSQIYLLLKGMVATGQWHCRLNHITKAQYTTLQNKADLRSCPVWSSELCIWWKFPPAGRRHARGSAGCSLKSEVSLQLHPHPVAKTP